MSDLGTGGAESPESPELRKAEIEAELSQLLRQFIAKELDRIYQQRRIFMTENMNVKCYCCGLREKRVWRYLCDPCQKDPASRVLNCAHGVESENKHD